MVMKADSIESQYFPNELAPFSCTWTRQPIQSSKWLDPTTSCWLLHHCGLRLRLPRPAQYPIARLRPW